jgi:hypothetical protein
MGNQPLPDFASVVDDPTDRPHRVSSFTVFDDALSDAFDEAGVVVEVPDDVQTRSAGRPGTLL